MAHHTLPSHRLLGLVAGTSLAFSWHSLAWAADPALTGGQTIGGVSTQALLLGGGVLVAACLVCSWISARWAEKRSAAQRTHQLLQIIEEAALPVMLHAEDGEILIWSQPWEMMTGYAPSQFTRLDGWIRRAHETEDEAEIARLRVIYGARGDGGEVTVRNAMGGRLTWAIQSRAAGTLADGRRATISTAIEVPSEPERDVQPERHVQNEADLHERENRYRVITELTSDIVFAYEIGADGEKTAKWQVGAIAGLAADAEPLAWMARVHPEDRGIVDFNEQRLTKGQPTTYEFRFLPEDGNERWVRVHSRPELDDENRVIRVVGAAKEITQDKRWEEALAESESKLQATSRTARVGYWEYYPFENRTICSNVIWQIWGLRPAHVGTTGKLFMMAVHPEDRDRVAAAYEHAHARNQLEFRIIRPDGSVRYVYEDFTVDFNESGDAVRYFGVTQDITDRKLTEQALRDSEARYHAIVEDQTEMIRRCTPEGVCTFVNNAYCQCFGGSRDDLIGQLVGSEMAADAGAAYLEMIRGLGPDNPIRETVLQVRAQSGELRWHHWTDRAVFDKNGTVSEVQGVGRDITDMKRAEDELAQAKDAAEQASAAKSRFLAAASHDLRQPLQALGLFVNVLGGRELDPKSGEIIGRIRDCTVALERLLGSLLDISKLDAGLFVPQKRGFVVSSLTGRLCAEMRPVAEEKDLELIHVPCSAHIHTDPGLLDRILRNFVSNAIRQTETGRLLVGSRRQAGQIRIEVWDTRVGIPEDQLALIFEEFHQVGNPARDRREGLGLGLAIVDRLARLLEHQVGVSSTPGRGSVFSISVPLAEAQKAPVAAEDTDRPEDISGAMVVAIDDEVDIRDALELLLDAWGCQALVAESTDEALQALKREGRAPDLVIADYRLKHERTGAESISAIRAAWGAEVPGFLLTGDTGPDRLREATASGFEVIHKPIKPDILRKMVATHVRDRKRAREDSRRQHA